jgi:CheY-like chemotaxis protein
VEDQSAKLFAGHVGVCAVLVNLLIDKGVVGRDEFLDRLRRAHAAHDLPDPVGADALAQMVDYLEPVVPPAQAAADRPPLHGQTVLVVEAQAAIARELQAALEKAGAEVLVARDASAALPCIERFDFSAAVLNWQPECNDHRSVVRCLKGQGVRLLFYAAQPPEDVSTARGAPIFFKPARPEEIVKALALLIAGDMRE